MTEFANPAPDTVTVWSDIGCPWATLALHTLHAAAAGRGQQIFIDHRAFPLELFNRMPTPKLILEAEIVTIAGVVPELGWRQWSGPDAGYPVTMLPALEAVQAAKDPAIGGLRASATLDAALRTAFYARSRCISIHSVILDVAADLPEVDQAALAEALAEGTGRRAVYQQWELARSDAVQGSPHLFTADGHAVHNPGATYHWTGRFPDGLPRLDAYDVSWAEQLLDKMTG